MKTKMQNMTKGLAMMLLFAAATLMPQVANADGTQPSSGNGTSSSPYTIASAGNLLWFADQVNGGNNNICGKLTADISLLGTTNDYVIGTKEYGFKGEFDGQGHTISGVNVTTTKTGKNSYKYAGGLFGCIDVTTNTPAVVKNVTVEGSVNITGLKTVYYIGGVIAIAWGDVKVSNVISKVNITIGSDGDDAHCGGVVGSVEWFENGNYDGELTVRDCVNYGTLNVECGEICGGIVGYIRNGSITDCLNVGNITNSENGTTGGILGYVNTTDFSMMRCLNIGTITAENAYSVYYAKNGNIGSTTSLLYYKSGVGGKALTANEVSAEEIKNGGLAYTLGTGSWGQSLGNNSVNDAYPVPNKTDYKVHITGTGDNIYFYNNITSTIPTGDFTTAIETKDQYKTNHTRIGDTRSFTVTVSDGKYISTVTHNGTTLTASNVNGNVNTYSYTVALNNTFSISTVAIEYTKPAVNGFTTNLPDNLNDKQFGSTVDFWVKPNIDVCMVDVTYNSTPLTPNRTDTDRTKHYTFTVATENVISVTTTPHNYENDFCTNCGSGHPATLDSDGYYEIADAGHLYWFAESVNSGETTINGKLTADIVVNQNVLYDEGNLNGDGAGLRVWTPILDYEGNFDGKGHTISGLYFNDDSKDKAGLFGNIYQNCTIKNVGVIDSYFYAGWHVGGLVGYNSHGTITNCYNTSTIAAMSDYDRIKRCAGGICGLTVAGNISNCYSTGLIKLSVFKGAICGFCEQSAVLYNCYYLEGTCAQGIGKVDECSANVEEKTSNQFVSGEVAWKLNNTEFWANPTWRQTIGEDPCPVLGAYHGIVTPSYEGLNTVIRPESGAIVGATAVYEFAGIVGKDVYGIPIENKHLSCERPFIFMTDKEYVSFVPSEAIWHDGSETHGLLGVLDKARRLVYGNGNNVGEPVSIVFTPYGLKYADPNGIYVEYSQCYIDAATGIVDSVPDNAEKIARFSEGVDGIESITIDAEAEGEAYNLQGIPVGDNNKGIIIQNGKKILR
ncbi:MAG: hypothetical protein HUJ98_04370 [Bacteroidaceae bacterium]|nr:hypothetical protein [Bacteroidaceae bacterium]